MRAGMDLSVSSEAVEEADSLGRGDLSLRVPLVQSAGQLRYGSDIIPKILYWAGLAKRMCSFESGDRAMAEGHSK
jgi:hypothetical protein